MSAKRETEILLAEDDPADAELTLRSLRKHNFADLVHWVRNGADALDFLLCEGAYAARDPSRMLKLALLDIKMPKVDGIEVLRRVKADARTRATPVVMLTSSGEARDVVESYNLGVNSYVVKPVQFEAFMEAVSRVGLYWMQVNRPPR